MVAETKQFKIGDKVRVLWRNCPERWQNDWMDVCGEGVEAWIVSVRYCPIFDVSYGISEKWPMLNRSNEIDGFCHDWLELI